MNKFREQTIKRLMNAFPFMENVKLDKWLRRDIDFIDPTVFIVYSKRTNLYELHAASSLYKTGIDRLDTTYQVSFKNIDFDLIKFLYDNSIEINSFEDRIDKMNEAQDTVENEKKAEQKLMNNYLVKVGRDNLKI